jgi:hypothetical protein
MREKLERWHHGNNDRLRRCLSNSVTQKGRREGWGFKSARKGTNMTNVGKLEIVANITAILTFVGAVGAWCFYQYGFIRKRRDLEKCLEHDGKPCWARGTPGAFTFQHITAKTGLTESEILRASFRNHRINRLERKDQEGYTKEILFQYNRPDSEKALPQSFDVGL